MSLLSTPVFFFQPLFDLTEKSISNLASLLIIFDIVPVEPD